MSRPPTLIQQQCEGTVSLLDQMHRILLLERRLTIGPGGSLVEENVAGAGYDECSVFDTDFYFCLSPTSLTGLPKKCRHHFVK